jgi:hypothetical protein
MSKLRKNDPCLAWSRLCWMPCSTKGTEWTTLTLASLMMLLVAWLATRLTLNPVAVNAFTLGIPIKCQDSPSGKGHCTLLVMIWTGDGEGAEDSEERTNAEAERTLFERQVGGLGRQSDWDGESGRIQPSLYTLQVTTADCGKSHAESSESSVPGCARSAHRRPCASRSFTGCA